MRIPPSAARPPAPLATPPRDPAAPGDAPRADARTVARLIALRAQQPGVAVLLGDAASRGMPGSIGGPGTLPSASPHVAPGAAMHASTSPSIPGGSTSVVDALMHPTERGDATRAAVALLAVADATEANAAERRDSAAPPSRVIELTVRLDPASWLPALHGPLLQRMHERHAARAVGLPAPARPATRSELRALGRWLAARSEVATGDPELVRLARALRLDRRLVRVAVATAVLATLALLVG